jgi:hypothetical protein
MEARRISGTGIGTGDRYDHLMQVTQSEEELRVAIKAAAEKIGDPKWKRDP